MGNVIVVYADFSGLGKNCNKFPDRESFRIRVEDLRKPEIRERLVKIWTDPKSLDPSHERVRVTRQIPERLDSLITHELGMERNVACARAFLERDPETFSGFDDRHN